MGTDNVETLKQWREKHKIEILDANRLVLLEIRDGTGTMTCPECDKEINVRLSPKDRLEATRQLSQMVSGLVPEKVTAGDKETLQQIAVDELPEEDKTEIDELIKGKQAWEDKP